MKSGLIIESPRRKDFAHERIFGAAPFLEEVKPLGRDISDIPVVYQGRFNTCVSATITWIRQFEDNNKTNLSHEWLADISQTGEQGAKPSQVLEPARKTGIITQGSWDMNLEKIDLNAALNEAYEYHIDNYFYVQDLSKFGLYHALKDCPLAIGVISWKEINSPHMMAAYDVTEDGQALKCANWWKEDEQDVQEVPFEKVILAVAVKSMPEGFTKKDARLSYFTVLRNKLKFYLKYALK